jgi:hypothetical protein
MAVPLNTRTHMVPRFSLGSFVRLKRNGQVFRVDEVEQRPSSDGPRIFYMGRTEAGHRISAFEHELESSGDQRLLERVNGHPRPSVAQAVEGTPHLEVELSTEVPPAVILKTVYPQLTVEYAMDWYTLDELILELCKKRQALVQRLLGG